MFYLLITIRIAKFLEDKDENGEFRRKKLWQAVKKQLEDPSSDLPSDSVSFEYPSKLEKARKARQRREQIADYRAQHAIPFQHPNILSLVPDMDLSQAMNLDKDVNISDDAKKIEKRAKKPTSTKPAKKKQKLDDPDKKKNNHNPTTLEKWDLKRTNDSSTISIGTLKRIIGENEPGFLNHILRCINKVRDIRNMARLDGLLFFTEFFGKYGENDYDTVEKIVENIKAFAPEYLEKRCDDPSLRDKRLEAINKIKVSYKGRNSSAGEGVDDETDKDVDDSEMNRRPSTSKKRKRKSKKESGPQVDMSQTLRDIVRYLLFEPVKRYVRHLYCISRSLTYL